LITDTELLDWLSANPGRIIFQTKGDGKGYVCRIKLGDKTESDWSEPYQTLSEAIVAGMVEGKGAKTRKPKLVIPVASVSGDSPPHLTPLPD